MNLLGGFAAVTYIPQALVDRTIDTIWTVLWPLASIEGDFTIPTPVGDLVFGGGVIIEKPQIVLSNSQPGQVLTRTGGFARFNGRVGMEMAGILLRFDCEVGVPLSVTEDNLDMVTIDFRQFDLSKLVLNVLWSDQPLGASILEQAIRSDEFRDWVGNHIRALLGDRLKIQVDASAIAKAQTAVFVQAANSQTYIIQPNVKLGGVRSLDGWLAIGIDTTHSTDFLTHGDLQLVAPPPVPGQFAGTAVAAVDADLICRLLEQNININVLIATASYSQVHPNKDAKVTTRSAPLGFTGILTGHVDNPDPFPGGTAFIAEVDVDLRVSAGTLDVTATPHVGVASWWFADVINAVTKVFGVDLFKQINDINDTSYSVPLTTSVQLGDFNGVNVRASLRGLEMDLVSLDGPGGIGIPLLGGPVLFGYVDVDFNTKDIQPQPTDIIGLITPFAIGIRERNLSVSYQCPKLRFDPSYFVVYTLRGASDDHLIATESMFSGGIDTRMKPIDLWLPITYLENDIKVDISIQRPPGTEVHLASTTIGVSDKFDRSFRYVRWSTDHVWIDKTKVPQPQHMARTSAVHRTDIHRRCRFCDRPGRHTQRFDSFNHIQTPTPGDMSDRFCPYCFTKQELENPLLILAEEQE